jgi:hypothetical protein
MTVCAIEELHFVKSKEVSANTAQRGRFDPYSTCPHFIHPLVTELPEVQHPTLNNTNEDNRVIQPAHIGTRRCRPRQKLGFVWMHLLVQQVTEKLMGCIRSPAEASKSTG